MNMRRRRPRSIRARLTFLFSLVLIAFALIHALIYSTLLRSRQIEHYSQSMQRHAYAISQNLSELVAPSNHEALDETRFIVSEDTLAPYMALMEQLTRCDVYLISAEHDVLGYFDGVVQRIDNPLLPAYIEQSIALGFMGKTPFIQAQVGQDTHLTACMPVMNAQSRVLGVVLLETTLRELGYTQSPTAQTLLFSCLVSFLLSVLLAMIFSRQFTHPIFALQKVALSLAQGRYETRTQLASNDEIGSLARSMDILAERLEDSRRRDERLRSQQQAFFSNVSHELKTPVTVIRGSLEALSDGVVSDEQTVRAYYAQMITESRWLQRLIQDLLELSRLQNLEFSLDMTDIDLGELLGDVAMSAHALCERKGVRLDCQEPQERYPFRGDYTRLRQMLLAIVDNAVKFTPPGKSVSLRLTGPRPVIVIADEGDGIPEEEIPRIFDRYHHTRDASRESTGLGLAIVREIARRHGIRIDVNSRVGEGSAFILTFPETP
ncbi:MAG: HAMP domain-containing sensor histidine kinase [Clostridia bacterium]|nr:HAMP domain-containing sensor histidine kinase [Clostridia bacterium]